MEVCRVKTWAGEAPVFSAKKAAFVLTPKQLDKNSSGEPIKLKGSLSMSDEKWTRGTFDTEGLAFTEGGSGASPEPVSPDPGIEEPAAPGTEEEKDLDDMNVDELKAYAEAHGIDLTGKTLKADILAAIKEVEAQAE